MIIRKFCIIPVYSLFLFFQCYSSYEIWGLWTHLLLGFDYGNFLAFCRFTDFFSKVFLSGSNSPQFLDYSEIKTGWRLWEVCCLASLGDFKYLNAVQVEDKS